MDNKKTKWQQNYSMQNYIHAKLSTAGYTKRNHKRNDI